MPTQYEPWTFENLWNKATVYATRAHEANREGEVFPFWSILTLEIIARAVLAHTHPVLLADLKYEKKVTDNVMTAFGLGTTREPRSITTNIVFERCKAIVEGLTDNDIQICDSLMKLRNEEVHTGKLAFAGYSQSKWLSNYYRILKVLVQHVGKNLEDLLEQEDAKYAEKLIKAAEEKNIGEVAKKIDNSKKELILLSEDELTNRRSQLASNSFKKTNSRKVICPICSSEATILGDIVRRSEVRLDEGELVNDITFQPSAFSCDVCQLSLNSLSEIFAASKVKGFENKDKFESMTNQFTGKEYTSIEEYYREYFEPDPSDYYDEYMDE